MCYLLGNKFAFLLMPCTSRERSCDMVHYNCLDSLTAGLKQTTTFCLIAHIYHDLYQRIFGWFCGLASELELAHSGAVHPANSPGPGASVSDRAQHLALQAPTSHQAKTWFGALCDGRGRERVAIHASAPEYTAPHSPSQMSPLHRLPL
jgi:hypothetical protein